MDRVLKRIERWAARWQGKGYGAATIAREVKAVARLIPTLPNVVIDVGANVGNYAAAVRKRFPDCSIHMFEPSSSNLQVLRERFADDARVTIRSEALGSRQGIATLFADSPGSGLGSLTRRRLDHFGLEFDHEEDVKITRFEDYWISNLERCTVDLAKLDVEGHELEVLEGFGAAIAHTRLIQFEFGGCNIDTRTYFQDFWYFFKGAGFRIYRIGPFSVRQVRAYSELDEIFSTTNFIAVSALLK